MDTKRDIFLRIIEDHKGILYKIARSYCQHTADHEDLIQEMIIQLWLSFSKYNHQTKYSTWTYRIALNTAISYYRKQKISRERTISLTPMIETQLDVQATDDPHPDVVILNQFIQQLKPIDKALFILYLEGVKQNQIAEVIGISSSNVSTKISRIKKHLRQEFFTQKAKHHD